MTSGAASIINIKDHGTALDKKKIRVQCNYCNKVMSGFFRLKCHLGGIRKDVVPCEKVPESVKEEFRDCLLEAGNQSISKEVGKMSSHPNLPWKRNQSPNSNGVKHIKREANQSAGGHGIDNNVEKDSSVVDDCVTTEYLPRCDRKKLDSKTALNGKPKDLSTMQVQRCIGRFFYETGIDFSVTNSPSFHRMLNATLGNDQGKVKVPTIQELKGWILEDELKELQERVKKIRDSWTSTGCTVLLDGWVDEKGRDLVSFLVQSPENAIYLHSADVSGIVNDVDALQMLLEGVIKEVGVENVVQIISFSSTGWAGAVGKQFMQRCRTVFWSVSASHCIELMLERIGTMKSIRDTLEKAKIITKFVYRDAGVVELMRNYTHGYDLIKPSKFKMAAPFLTLENIMSEKKHLKNMFASCEWRNTVWASTPEGKEVANLVSDHSFWTGAETALKATVPLLRVLCLVNEVDAPQLGYIYETMDQAKETIRDEYRNKKSQYTPVWAVIDEIWNKYLHIPLHAAGYYLNPSLFYSTDFFLDPEVAFGLLCCIVRMVQDQHTQDLVSLQLDEYRHAKGAFEEGSAIDKRTNVSPTQWWSIYGRECPELQRFAIRILSQTCDGASRYGLKRCLAEKLLSNERNRIEQQRLSDLAYLHYNLQLQNNIKLGGGDDGGSVVVAGEIDPMDIWVTGK